ncbi:MAG: hypothetical protein JXB48_11790 [Candidatus Latescibacteria bacterium]|nr:hypothetical protein [Candidatus Latescibacterota bacterium]
MEYRNKYNFYIFFIFVMFIFACSESRLAVRYSSLIGTWRTERGIIMNIQVNDDPELGAEASIIRAPGFIGGEFSVGKIVISKIKPIPDGGWSGLFIMPGYEKPVKVDISVFTSGKMLIISRDKRVKKNRMIWNRVRSIPEDQ